MGAAGHDPERIERFGESGLKIRWSDGHESLYPWGLLRAGCPCAACREGAPPDPAAPAKPVELHPVGRYAVAIRWSDGHVTGIYSHQYLRSLCPCEACRPGQLTEG